MNLDWSCDIVSCSVRAVTLRRLRELTDGVLSHVLRQVLATDPLAPLLTDSHYEAIDRRLAIVLHYIDDYIGDTGVEAVLVSDGYS